MTRAFFSVAKEGCFILVFTPPVKSSKSHREKNAMDSSCTGTSPARSKTHKSRYTSLSALLTKLENSYMREHDEDSCAVIFSALQGMNAWLDDLYTPRYPDDIIIGDRQDSDFREQVVVVECLRALRLNRGNLYGSSSTEDFRILGRVLDMNWRTVQSHYSSRCKVAAKFGRQAFYNIGDLAEEFISWSRESGKQFDDCRKKEICDAVNFGNYGTYRLQYHDKLREEVRRHLEPPESWSGPEELGKLLHFINRTTRLCLVTNFHFTLDVVARALIRAKLRGVCVVIFVDKRAAWAKDSAPVINSLIRAGISVFEPGDASMVHTKQILADSTLVTGSHSLSEAAYGNPLLALLGIRPKNHEHSSSSNSWSAWKQEAQLFYNHIENGVLIRDEKPVTNAVVH